MMPHSQTDIQPWYKQPWLWFILSPLFAVFVMGFTMLYLSIATNDGVIVDNYYKDGLAIKTRSMQDEYARSRNLAARLSINNSNINLVLTGDIIDPPAALNLHLIHPTQEDFDSLTVLQFDEGVYRGFIDPAISGRYKVMLYPQLQPDSENMWRLHSLTSLPQSEILDLMPN